MSVAAAVRRVEKKAPNLFHLLTDDLEKSFRASLKKQFRPDPDDPAVKKSREWWNKVSETFEVNSEVGKVKAVFNISTDSEYAEAREKGGFIKAVTRASSVKRRKEVWVMEQYFWWRMYETTSQAKKDIYKWIALSVMKNDGVKAQKRPFLDDALDDFEPEKEKLFEEFIQQLIFEYEFETSQGAL